MTVPIPKTASCRLGRRVVHPRRLDRTNQGAWYGTDSITGAGNPSGLPFVRASRRCLSNSVRYVRRRSFGGNQVDTRLLCDDAHPHHHGLGGHVPRLDAPALGDRAQHGTRPVAAARDPGVDRFLAAVCRVDLPLVVANGDRPGHLVVVRKLQHDGFRALQAGAVKQSEHGYITGADRIGTRRREQPPNLARFDVSSCTPAGPSHERGQPAPLRLFVRFVLDSDPRLVVYQPELPCYAHRTPVPRKHVVDGARCGVAVDHIRTQPFDLSPAYLRPVERRGICDGLVSEDCDRAVECPARRRPACRPSQPAPRDPQGPRHPPPTRGTPRSAPARGHSAPANTPTVLGLLAELNWRVVEIGRWTSQGCRSTWVRAGAGHILSTIQAPI